MVSEKPHLKKFQSKGPIHKPLILWITENYTTYDAELLNVSIRRIRLFSCILLNKKNRRKFNL